ncbi:MAG: serine/threonine protein kinase [Acidobacteriia bacterium]|nr:serine/threonine protein kinase [Terriglobia bacterium]
MPSVLSGNQVDHYALETLVATSNTASIYRGTDLLTGRQVAIKIPHLEVEGDPLFYERFRREQEIGQKLNHPSIVKFIPDETRSRVYLVMEWVDGQLLRHLLSEQGKLPLERALRITVGICDALEYMHSQGVAHRDLKPENIMVDAEDHIKLMDFGIAGLAGARRLTFGKLSQVMGTPDYISPEQVKGKRGDARCDIFAAGVILYEMLTGSTPFPGENPFTIMNNRLIQHPVPPRELDPGISAELQEILYRALERDPRNRYAKAREFSWDLQHPDQVGVADRPEMRNWQRRRPHWIKALLLYGGLALIPVFVFTLLLLVAQHS